MALPNNVISIDPQSSPFLSPDNLPYNPFLVYERGGVDIQDTSEGIQNYIWVARYVDNAISLERSERPPVTLLNHLSNVDSIDLTFDQNMNPIICYEIAGTSYLYWFDSSVGNYVTTTFANCRSPRVSLDDKRKQFLSSSDVIFAYIKSNGDLAYRQQRDRYLIERILGSLIPDHLLLEKIGMSITNRFYFKVSPLYIMPTCALNNIVSGLT